MSATDRARIHIVLEEDLQGDFAGSAATGHGSHVEMTNDE